LEQKWSIRLIRLAAIFALTLGMWFYNLNPEQNIYNDFLYLDSTL